MAKKDVMIPVKKGYLSRLTRNVRDLEQENAKLLAHMKIIQEAARESQTRDRIYNKREEVPAEKRPQRSDGDGIRKRDTRPLLRGDGTLFVDGVQIPTLNSTPYKPNFRKSQSETKPPTTKVVGKSTH